MVTSEFHVCTIRAQVKCVNAHGRTSERSHVSAVRKDQCARIDVALPSAREVNGGGGAMAKGWEESGMRGAR